MMTTTTLTCQFKDNLGHNRSLTIDQPRADLTAAAVKSFMEYAIAADVYHPNQEDVHTSLAYVKGAMITRRTVETLDLSESN